MRKFYLSLLFIILSSVIGYSQSAFDRGYMTYEKGDFYLNGTRLEKQVLKSMIGSDAFDNIYTPALSQRKTGKTFTIVGIVALGLGVDVAVYSGVQLVLNQNLNDIVYKEDVAQRIQTCKTVLIISSVVAGLGAISLCVGLPKQKNANNRLRSISDSYNSGSYHNISMSIGLTENGYGLALNF